MTTPSTKRWVTLSFVFALLFLLFACRPDGATSPAESLHVPGQLKLLVEEDGPYRLTRDDLVQAGLEVPSPLQEAGLRLTDAGQDVPFLIGDDALFFYGRAASDRYYAARPYILQIGEAGRPMGTREPTMMDPAPLVTVRKTMHLEEDHLYLSEARQQAGDDVWFWAKVAQQELFETSFELPALGSGTAALRLNAWGFTHNPEVDLDHDFELLLNDVVAGAVAWDGPVSHTAELTVADGLLVEGTNTLTVDNSAEGASFLDIIQLNWLELDFPAPPLAINDQLTFSAAAGTVDLAGFSDRPLILDISDPAEPLVMQGWTYENGTARLPVDDGVTYSAAGPDGFLTPTIEQVQDSLWRDPGQQADLIIITTAELAPALQPLAEARREQGLAVAVAAVEEIYDAFGFGAPSPDSINAFLRYAYENWQAPQPRYVLLVGDATSDYLAQAADLPRNHVPSPMVPVQFSGETVSDSRLADVDGDHLPDLAIGRWPVQTAEEVAALIERTLDYEAKGAAGRAIFATDGSEQTFSVIAGRLAEAGGLAPSGVAQLDGPTAAELGETWREGAWLATYVGHGSIDRWGKEDMFSLSELDQLRSQEGSAPPIVLQLTCLTGLFSHPEQTSLAEAMLSHPQGPVLIVAASSLTLSAHQEPFAVDLLQQLQDSNIKRAGDAFLNAKRALDVESSDGLREISDTFALFGDPSAAIVRP